MNWKGLPEVISLWKPLPFFVFQFRCLRLIAQVEIMQLQPFEHLGVVHTRRPNDAQVWADHLRERMGFRGQMWVTETGAALSSHAGPGVIALIGVEK